MYKNKFDLIYKQNQELKAKVFMHFLMMTHHRPNKFNESLSKNHHSLILFVDFSKAFDTLSKKNIIKTLENCGIRGPIIEWFEEYLKDRTYKVKIGETFSKEMDVNYGVPQGSKLGPLLYIIYTNSLINYINNCKTFAYADDTAVIVTHKNLPNAVYRMQQQTNIVAKWAHDHGLIINKVKTKIMHIKPQHSKIEEFQIYFEDINCSGRTGTYSTKHEIEQVEQIKYLGVIIDNKLRWSLHIEYLKNKLRKAAFALYNLSVFTKSKDILIKVYHAICESHLRFGITAWGVSSHCKSLEALQNKIIKLINNNKNNQEVFKPLKIESLFQSTMLNTYYDSREYFFKIDHLHNTRQKIQGYFKVKSYFNNYGKYTLPSMLPLIANKLPANFMEFRNHAERKRKLKEFFKNIPSKI